MKCIFLNLSISFKCCKINNKPFQTDTGVCKVIVSQVYLSLLIFLNSKNIVEEE